MLLRSCEILELVRWYLVGWGMPAFVDDVMNEGLDVAGFSWLDVIEGSVF